ncbi:MAG: GumC family protein, partial [Tannerellaceae bacterium]
MIDEQNNIQEEEINLRDIIDNILNHWYWFALSILATLSFAVGYLYIATPIYKTEASILLQDEKKGGGTNELAMFQDLGMFGNMSNNIENEILVFKSNTLALRVVEALRLDINYTSKSHLRSHTLYGNSPIKISYIKQDSFPITSQTFTIEIESAQNFRITPNDKESTFTEATLAFNTPVSLPFGTGIVTLDETHLAETKEISVTFTNPQVAARSLSQNIAVSLANKNASVLNMSIQGTSQNRNIDILNTYIQLYNDEAINDKNRVARNTASFINDRLLVINDELGGVEQQVETYKKTNNLTNIEEEARLTLQKGSEYEAKIIETETQLRLIQFVKEYLAQSSGTFKLIPANLGIADAALTASIVRYNEQCLEYDRMRASTKEQNPILRTLHAELESLRTSINQSVGNLEQSLRIQRDNLESQENRINNRVRSVPQQERELRAVLRNQTIKEQLYIYLLEKREENELSMSIAAPPAKIIDAAWGTNIPVAPKKPIILLAALLLGIAIPAIVLFILNMLNTKLKNRRDLERVVNAPLAAEIPRKHGDSSVVMTPGNREPAAEAFRMLRTNLDFMTMGQSDHNVIMITSTLPKEGKTYISVNLSLALAQSGKRVLLLGMDIRKPA